MVTLYCAHSFFFNISVNCFFSVTSQSNCHIILHINFKISFFCFKNNLSFENQNFQKAILKTSSALIKLAFRNISILFSLLKLSNGSSVLFGEQSTLKKYHPSLSYLSTELVNKWREESEKWRTKYTVYTLKNFEEHGCNIRPYRFTDASAPFIPPLSQSACQPGHGEDQLKGKLRSAGRLTHLESLPSICCSKAEIAFIRIF